jgi:formylglycine-generating enzyme required for sulfatase activity
MDDATVVPQPHAMPGRSNRSPRARRRERGPSRSATVLLLVVLTSLVAPASAGPWSQLPDAIDRLGGGAADDAAERTLLAAESTIVAEIEAGRLAAARALFDAYASLVADLPNGRFRLATVERRLARSALDEGDRWPSSDLRRAGAVWALAAELDLESAAVDRLRAVLLPPAQAAPGDIWRAPLDGAVLIFHPAQAVRMGCTQNDNDCLADEVYFRWVEVPDRWYEAREVSNRRYRLCVEAEACTAPEDPTAYADPARADHPVVGVSWRQARTYARWAGRRLPSEAEWERAARGQLADARFPWGNDRRRDLANVWSEPGPAGGRGARPVGSFPAMGLGLRDIAGNVWEWCEDRYGPRFSADSDDGGAAREGWGRVVRGGSWRRSIDVARVSSRSWYDVGYFADDLGLRCVVDHNPSIDPEWIARTAQRAFQTVVRPGSELDGAELEAEDRRFLERRALTLMVVEGRASDGLHPAARRLAAEPGDPVAADLFARFETEVLAQASGNELDAVELGVAAYRAAVDSAPRLTGRFAAFQRQLLLVLRTTVSSAEQRGDRATGRRAAEIGLALARGDAVFAAAAVRLSRRTGETIVWAGDGKGMVWVAAQDFVQGASLGDAAAGVDESPSRRVSVAGFWIDRTEVTNDEYRGCVRAGGCTPPQRTEYYDDSRLGNHPVMWVDWYQAREYAAWAGKRLPSESEWELAARAGGGEAYPWGASWVPGRANAMGAYREDVWPGPAPVASFEANAWGIYDLIGNAAEWVDDVANPSYAGAPLDGRPWYQETGLAGERRRVVRGGGWDDPPPRQRVSGRTGRQPGNYNRSVGFRCVADE